MPVTQKVPHGILSWNTSTVKSPNAEYSGFLCLNSHPNCACMNNWLKKTPPVMTRPCPLCIKHDGGMTCKRFQQFLHLAIGTHWSPLGPFTKTGNAELWYFLRCPPKQVVEKKNYLGFKTQWRLWDPRLMVATPMAWAPISFCLIMTIVWQNKYLIAQWVGLTNPISISGF